MRYEFSKREKVMLVVLVLIIMALGYFKLILEPINEQIGKYETDKETEQVDIDQYVVKSAQKKKMSKEVEAIKESGEYIAIPAYDNSQKLLVELHHILASTTDYTLEFDEMVTNDYILCRPAKLSFVTANYQQARDVINKLSNSEMFNVIDDVSIDFQNDHTNDVAVYLTITYFEMLQK